MFWIGRQGWPPSQTAIFIAPGNQQHQYFTSWDCDATITYVTYYTSNSLTFGFHGMNHSVNLLQRWYNCCCQLRLSLSSHALRNAGLLCDSGDHMCDPGLIIANWRFKICGLWSAGAIWTEDWAAPPPRTVQPSLSFIDPEPPIGMNEHRRVTPQLHFNQERRHSLWIKHLFGVCTG